jgi:urease accessory protein
MKRALGSTKAVPAELEGVVVLDFDARQKHRFLAKLEGGGELAVELPRGSVLADGDYLETGVNAGVLVRAAAEELSVARAADALLVARVAYHLGNRHVALQIEPTCVKYRHDHVLDDLCRRLGAEVSFESAPFSPEGGAYGRGGHREHRAHQHDHGHPHAHDHADDHAQPDAQAHDHDHTRLHHEGTRR